MRAHHEVQAFDHAALDIGDHDAVRQTIDPVRPDAIVNLAAFTKVDANEAEPARAFRDNAMGPQHLALSARTTGAVLLHISTDYVFDGAKDAPYDEADEPAPLSVYGRAKLEGERFVRSITPASFIVRVGYVFGGGDDYLTGAARRLAAGEDAAAFEIAADRPHSWVMSPSGCSRWCSRGGSAPTTSRGTRPPRRSRCSNGCAIFGGFPRRRGAGTRCRTRAPAPRPAYSVLTSVYLEHLGVPPMPSLDEGLKTFLGSLYRP